MSSPIDLRSFINGERIDAASDRGVEQFDPATGRSRGTFAAAGMEAVEAAVSAARGALEGPWGGLPPVARAAMLKALADLIEQNAGRLAVVDCADMGKPVSAGGFEAGVVAAGFTRYYGEAIDKWQRGAIPATDAGAFEMQVHRPRGVIGAIIPWNFPAINLMMKIAPMLAAGNSVVVKPSEISPGSASMIAELAMEAGLPPGALNIVQGDGQTGDALARHGGIDMLAFTGSTATGKALMRAVGESTLKPVLLECGGKSPEIVFADMAEQDLDAIAAMILGGAMQNQGQICVARSRLYIEAPLYEKLVDKIVAQAGAMKAGDPTSPETRFGPLASARQREVVEGFIDGAEKDGGELLLDGRGACRESGGYFVEPTIVAQPDSAAHIMQNEIFGPVLTVARFDGEEEAARLANSTQYGLAATVWTRDLGRAHRMANAVHAGMTKIMTAPVERMGAGFAHTAEAAKQSGFGIEGGLGALESYSRLQAVEFHYEDRA
ncbi:MAG: aldehyde dehydrogenase family protein [Proteobacteria bacterium]|nr:aldehyde dehydrogenase family protein [Pseudomonadota bacterium]MDA0915225.1 aldehyde dehydrogenase family protein [Pseudomonadota bacterium]MDA1033454.1 aldehyde dehydrogenase family protein [Pseudomonadota bacterium]